MPSDGKQLLAGYMSLDAKLVEAGRHPTSRTWLRTLKRFWLSGKTRLVVRKGRQAGGSTTMARVAVATALFGAHRSPPGTRLGFPFISVKLEEAAERLANIADTLDVAGVPYARRGDRIELSDRPYFFLLLPCSYRTNVGGTNAAAWEDEVCRWWSDEENANPAIEVDASLVPSLATQPNARLYTISSPLGLDDFHAELFARGDTPDQMVAEGASWYWNPAITEEATRALQPDERRWQREFAAVPQFGALSAFDREAVDRAIAREGNVEVERAGVPVIVVDPSSGKSDAWAWCFAQWVLTTEGKRHLRIAGVDAVEGRFWQQVGGEEIVGRIAVIAGEHGVRDVHADQREGLANEALFRQHGLRYTIHDWTEQSKVAAVERVRRWLADDVLILPSHEKLRRQMLAMQEKFTRRGEVTISGRGTRHDDFAALVITAAMVDIDDGLRAPRPEGRRFLGGVATWSGADLTVGGEYTRINQKNYYLVDGKLVIE